MFSKNFLTFNLASFSLLPFLIAALYIFLLIFINKAFSDAVFLAISSNSLSDNDSLSSDI